MAFDPPSTVGASIASAVKAVGVSAGSPVTDAQLTAIWTAVWTEILAQLAKANVAPGSFTSPVGPVTGVGGPLS
jgi:hypothetical protein